METNVCTLDPKISIRRGRERRREQPKISLTLMISLRHLGSRPHPIEAFSSSELPGAQRAR